VSFEHHRTNMDFAHFLELRAQALGTDGLEEFGPPPPVLADPAARFREFIRSDSVFGPPTLAGVLHHMQTAWRRRRDGNVVMVHYADLTSDLPGETRRLATALGIPITAVRASELAREAGLDRMRARARELAPESSRDNWKDATAFFRAGGFGEWRDRVDEHVAAEYEARVASLVPADVAAWTHLGRIVSGIDPLA
jgi:hypothetical protein